MGSFIGALPAAILTARVGNRQTLLAGLLVLGTSSAAFGLAHSLWLLDALRAAQGVGSALSWTGALAWLVSATPSERRGDLLGRAPAAAAAGGLVGPGVGAIASSAGTGATFVVLGVATSALALLLARLGSPPRPAAPSTRHLVSALGQRTVAAGLWLMALPSIMVVIGSIFVLAAIVESLSSVLAGRWADRSGRHSPLQASLAAVVVF